jgi:dephospho-CoA kinase
MKKLIFVTGASGAGKTATLKTLESEKMSGVIFCYFDSIGVPSDEEMIARFGSGEEWQRQSTIEWVRRIKQEYLADSVVILDGQARQSFIVEACAAMGVGDYAIILFDCAETVRNTRLHARGQPELANSRMENWALYLRDQSRQRGDVILDTTHISIPEAAQRIRASFQSAVISAGAR